MKSGVNSNVGSFAQLLYFFKYSNPADGDGGKKKWELRDGMEMTT